MLNDTKASFAGLNLSGSQNNYNTISHKGLQSCYEIPVVNQPSPASTTTGSSSEPLPLPTSESISEPVEAEPQLESQKDNKDRAALVDYGNPTLRPRPGEAPGPSLRRSSRLTRLPTTQQVSRSLDDQPQSRPRKQVFVQAQQEEESHSQSAREENLTEPISPGNNKVPIEEVKTVKEPIVSKNAESVHAYEDNSWEEWGPAETPAKKESTAATILRRLSTRRRRDLVDRSDKYYPPIATVRSLGETPPLTIGKSSTVRGIRDRSRDVPPASILRSGSSQPHHSDLLTPPQSADNHRIPKGLGRSASITSSEYRRRHDDSGSSASITSGEYRRRYDDSGSSDCAPGVIILSKKARDSKQKINFNPQSTKIRAKSLGHSRRPSIQARRAKREEAREANVLEETKQDIKEHSRVSAERFDSAENVKPVFLKDLFSVSITSTKPVAAIRLDIIRVLQQLGVEYIVIRGGFSCWKPRRIDLKKVVDLPPVRPQPPTPIYQKRISFGGFILGEGSNQDREDFRDSEKVPQTPKTPRKPAADMSYTNSDISDESVGHENPGGSSRRTIGESSTYMRSELGDSMILKFEIFIIKVPLLSLHGIQFKRLAGGTWNYKSMADQILRELNL